MTDQVEYKPVNPLANKQPFKKYLSAAPTHMFRRERPFTAFTNPYIDNLRILTYRIKEINAKFIIDKSGLRLARVIKYTLKMVKYAPLEGRSWQYLPEFLSKKIVKIQNTDVRCFGYSLLYVLEQVNFPEKHCLRISLYKEEMF